MRDVVDPFKSAFIKEACSDLKAALGISKRNKAIDAPVERHERVTHEPIEEKIVLSSTGKGLDENARRDFLNKVASGSLIKKSLPKLEEEKNHTVFFGVRDAVLINRYNPARYGEIVGAPRSEVDMYSKDEIIKVRTDDGVEQWYAPIELKKTEKKNEEPASSMSAVDTETKESVRKILGALRI